MICPPASLSNSRRPQEPHQATFFVVPQAIPNKQNTKVCQVINSKNPLQDHAQSLASKRLPTPHVNLTLQLPTHSRRNLVVEPHIPQQTIVPLLIEEQATVMAEPDIRFTVDVEVRRLLPRAVAVVQEEHSAFADANEDADVFAAPVRTY